MALVAGFAAEAGVGLQVHPFLCDALEVPGKDRFDAIISLDSSCYLSRRAWFRRGAELLRRGGRMFIADCFVEQEAYRAPFDRYWCARIGAVEEYLGAARGAGLMFERLEEVSRLVANFWGTTMALIRVEAQETGASPRPESEGARIATGAFSDAAGSSRRRPSSCAPEFRQTVTACHFQALR